MPENCPSAHIEIIACLRRFECLVTSRKHKHPESELLDLRWYQIIPFTSDQILVLILSHGFRDISRFGKFGYDQTFYPSAHSRMCGVVNGKTGNDQRLVFLTNVPSADPLWRKEKA